MTRKYFSNDELPNEFYHAEKEHISKSWLDSIAVCPLLFKFRQENPQPETEALRIGKALHHFILERDTFDDYYFSNESVANLDRRTKKGKEAYNELIEKNSGKEMVKVNEIANFEGMYKSIFTHRKAKKLLINGEREHSVLWTDEELGAKCKARADYLRKDISFIVDLKTTTDASALEFAKSCAKYRYDVQDAHYRTGFECDHFVFIAVEKTPPYLCAVYSLDSLAKERGADLRVRDIKTYLECVKKGRWPSLSNTIEELELPAWSYRNVKI
jgi:hypothetical protein